MNKKNNNKGFTLAELLIVVAIIAVLVAIAIPVFTQQLEKSREATDLANVRSAYAELVTAYLTEGKAQSASVPAKQTIANWQSAGDASETSIGVEISSATGAQGSVSVPAATSGGSYTLAITDSGSITCSAS